MIRKCEIRNYDGDGISFQTTQRVVIENCESHSHAGCGLHPGCETENATVSNVRCYGNGGDGLFLCWNVKFSKFNNNDFSDNKRHGISIGMKDSDNKFLTNVITSNANAGIFFRKQPASNGAHRNVFKTNTILDNGVPVEIQGAHQDLEFHNNFIGNQKPSKDAPKAFIIDPESKGLKLNENELKNVKEK